MPVSDNPKAGKEVIPKVFRLLPKETFLMQSCQSESQSLKRQVYCQNVQLMLAVRRKTSENLAFLAQFKLDRVHSIPTPGKNRARQSGQ